MIDQPSVTDHLKLSEQYLHLRTAAMVLYDRGIRDGLRPEVISKQLDPFTKQMHDLIIHSAHNNVVGLIVLAKRFEGQSEALKKDIEFLSQKIRDISYHSELISKALAYRMNKEGVKSLTDDSFVATLTDINGVASITYR